MIDVLFEQRITQNTGLAAETLWHAINEAHIATGKVGGISLPLIFLVLPLAFHQRSAHSLSNRTQPGALYKALAEDREIVVGVQDRMQSMSPNTLGALSLGFSAGLFLLDKDAQRTLLPKRKTPPVEHSSAEVKDIFAAAKRVGQALVEMSPSQLVSHLRVRF